MAMAGFDPRTAPTYWERMETEGNEKPPEFLSTHPDPTNRIEKLIQIMLKAVEYYEKK